MTHTFTILDEQPEVLYMGDKRVLLTNDTKYDVGDTVYFQRGREEETPFEVGAVVSEIPSLKKGYVAVLMNKVNG
jgi:hypothetical protein